MNRIRRLVFTGLCVALGVVLPLALHAVPKAGNVLLPMHIPVLLCGLACGPWYGLACGAVLPLVSSLITGMPVPAYLPAMTSELAVYGLASGLLMKWVRVNSKLARIYIALAGAMLIGRLVYGVLNALIFQAGAYSMQLWLTGVFVAALPGIIIQLIALPALILALERLKLIEL